MKMSKIAVVDDDIFIRESWESYVVDCETITFESPEAFLHEFAADPTLKISLAAIIVDYSFGTKSSMTGSDLAAELRKLTCLPIILSSDMCRSQIVNFEVFDLHLDKNFLDWQNLSKFFCCHGRSSRMLP